MTQDQIRASFQIKENSITPNLIDYSGSAPTDEQSLVYDAGADKFKWTTISGAAPQGTTVASGITTDTTNFNSRLTVLDNTVQKALDTLDDHTHTVLPSVTVTGTLTTNGNTTIGGNMLMDSNRLELSTAEAGDYSTTLFKKSSTPSLGSIFQLESLAPSGTLAGGTSTKLVAGIDGFLDSGEVYVSMNDSGVRSFYADVDKIYLQGSVQLYNTALPDTPNANNGTIYVQSGILGFKDDDGVVNNILTTVDSDYQVTGGWTKSRSTWTYASASTFTVAGDVTSIYTKGAKIKWTQTTVKYGVVASSSYSAPNTTITIIVNSDYTVANAAITDNYYSYQDSPAGFPSIFNYTPTWSTSGTQPSLGDGTLVGAWSVRGGYIRYLLQLTLGSSTTTGTGTMIFSIPRNSATAPVVTYWGNLYIFDADTSNRYHRLAGIGNNQSDFRYSFASNSLATTYQTTVTDPITFAQSDIIALDIEYVFI